MPRAPNNVLQLNPRLSRSEVVWPGVQPVYVPVDDLLTPRFLSRHTRFLDFRALLMASAFRPEQIPGLEHTIDPVWEVFIQRVSRFATWRAMLQDARGEWILHRLGVCVDSA